MNGYDVTAQYYDPLVEVTRQEINLRIANSLKELDIGSGTILDIGAGTGLSTELIASVLPEAEIYAIEPDPTMRSALMTRLWMHEGMRDRVTILPLDVLNAPLPDSISGALLSASLVHFSPVQRKTLWKMLAARLTQHGRIVVEVQCPEAINISEWAMPEARVGNVIYGAKASAKRIGPDKQQWRVHYYACLNGEVLTSDISEYECWTVSPEHVLQEAKAAGLNGYFDEELVILSFSAA